MFIKQPGFQQGQQQQAVHGSHVGEGQHRRNSQQHQPRLEKDKDGKPLLKRVQSTWASIDPNDPEGKRWLSSYKQGALLTFYNPSKPDDADDASMYQRAALLAQEFGSVGVRNAAFRVHPVGRPEEERYSRSAR